MTAKFYINLFSLTYLFLLFGSEKQPLGTPRSGWKAMPSYNCESQVVHKSGGRRPPGPIQHLWKDPKWQLNFYGYPFIFWTDILWDVLADFWVIKMQFSLDPSQARKRVTLILSNINQTSVKKIFWVPGGARFLAGLGSILKHIFITQKLARRSYNMFLQKING